MTKMFISNERILLQTARCVKKRIKLCIKVDLAKSVDPRYYEILEKALKKM